MGKIQAPDFVCVTSSHFTGLLKPLDVAVFGPFKTYYYQECAAFMQKYMGQSITRYDMTELACRAYLKAMTPVNIQAAFKRTGILPLERTIISKEKPFPCESFREEKPAEKLAAIKSGKEAIQEFIRLKTESSKSTPNDDFVCLDFLRHVNT
jgi:hypothetical protein